MSDVLTRRPETLDDLDVLLVDVAGSDRTRALLAEVGDLLQNRHFVTGVRHVRATDATTAERAVAVLATDHASVDDAVAAALELEVRGIPTAVIAPSGATVRASSPLAVELWFVAAPDGPVPADTLTAVELALCTDPYQLAPSAPADPDGPDCAC